MQKDVDLKTALRERLVFRRNGLNLTQGGLAEQSGLSERSISDYERGLSLPSLEQLLKLSQALDVRPGYLLGEETITEAALVHDRPQRQDVGGYSALETAALEKILADLSAKLPKFSPYERKHVLGNLRSVLDVLEERELTDEPKKTTGRVNSVPLSEDVNRAFGHSSAAHEAAGLRPGSGPKQKAESPSGSKPSPKPGAGGHSK